MTWPWPQARQGNARRVLYRPFDIAAQGDHATRRMGWRAVRKQATDGTASLRRELDAGVLVAARHCAFEEKWFFVIPAGIANGAVIMGNA